MSVDPGDVERLAADAVADLIAKVDPGAMATRHAVLVEVVGSDGDRALWMCAAEGQKAWDTLGLLQYGIAVEQAAINRDAFN